MIGTIPNQSGKRCPDWSDMSRERSIMEMGLTEAGAVNSPFHSRIAMAFLMNDTEITAPESPLKPL
jgi:hypothetical protein